MSFKRFEEIPVWQKARQFCKDIFQLTLKEGFRTSYKLRDQILASSGSIMDNIAEGYERDGNKELCQFLFIAKGSCGEARSQLYRAFDYGFISKEELESHFLKAVEISKELKAFILYIKNSDIKGIKYKEIP